MPSISLSSETFARLQAHAIPFVDTPETVIERLIDSFETGKRISHREQPQTGDVQTFSPNSPPDLRFTKILFVEVSKKKLSSEWESWNSLLHAMVIEAKKRVKGVNELKKLIMVPFVEGSRADSGFHYVSEAGLSVQGQDANGAWKAIYHIARELNLTVHVTFVWRDKEGASYPGKAGHLGVEGRS